MALLGNGVAAIWHNVEADVEADYNHWHCHEHMPERVAIPGFLRGRRYVAIAAERKFFHFYEAETLATLTSAAYLERLNNPTDWTRRVGSAIQDNNRTLCSVVASQGRGGGAAILTFRLSPDQDRAAAFTAWLVDTVFPELVAGPGVVGAHLLQGDQDASGGDTAEKALRGQADDVADWVMFIEAIEPEFLAALREGQLSDRALDVAGAGEVVAGLYRFHYELSAHELDQLGDR